MGFYVHNPHSGLRRAFVAVLLAMLACVALAACGGSGKSTKSSTRSTATKAHTKGTTAPQRRGLITVDDIVDDSPNPQHFRVTIYDLRRYGPFVILDFGYTCANLDAGCNPGDAFTLSETKQRSPNAFKYGVDTPNGVTLIDPSANKEYFPVSDSSGRSDVSTMPDQLNDTRTYLGWVTFAAPPSTTTSMDVLFPNGGPQVSAVPVTSVTAPTPEQLGSNVQAAAPAGFATPPGSTDTTGLNLPVESLVLTVGNPGGSDTEMGNKAKISLSADVLFHFDKSNLTPAASAIISRVASEIKARAIGPIQVTGYTDSIGSDAVNIPLSQARAQSVVRALTPLTPGASYQAAGMGSADPVAPNTLPSGADNPSGRRLNRRVTIAFQAKAPAPPTPPAPPQAAQTPTAPTSQVISYPAPGTNGDIHNYQLRVDSVYRDANLLVVRGTLTCVNVTNLPAGSTDGCDGNDFAGSPDVPPETPKQYNRLSWVNSTTLSTLYLDDPATGSEYIPLYRPDQEPVTGALTPFGWTAGQSYPVWAYFPAPPATSTKINVILAGGGAANGVPIEPSAPALSTP